MRRLSLWMRQHPMVGDTLIAVLFLLIDTAFFVISWWSASNAVPTWYIALPIDAAMVAPLAVRRKHPLLVAYAILVIGAVHAALELGVSSGIASGVAVYSVVVYTKRRHAGLYVVLTVIATVTQLSIQYPEESVVKAIVAVLLTALCWILGEFVAARRAYQAEVEARLHLLETERDQATRIAVAEERGRIARELHDVVAHAVSVMVVQADGASYAIRSKPDLAERAVHTISETGRGALNELRRLLDVLRADGADGEPRVPQPNVSDLADLTARVQSSGLPVDLEVDPDLGELPAGVSLGMYRIVQESLTNALKHAGSGARAQVRVERDGDAVRVSVYDDGAGKARPFGETQYVPPRGGNGLIGMHERAHVFGGTLHAGPDPQGGWWVRACLPLRLDG